MKTTLITCTTGLLLVACGGGHDGDVMAPPAAATQVPASALVSSASYTEFAVSLSGMSSENAEPLNADNVTMPPSSETDEPVAVG